MSQVVNPRTRVVACTPQPNLTGQLPKDTMNILMKQGAAALGHKEVWPAARSEMRIPTLSVAA